VRDERGETVEERVISAVKRLAGERAEHAAAVEKRTALEKQLADAAQLGERLATETGSPERRQRELERELTRRLPYRILIDKLPAGSRYRVEEG
jgi:hypothetical protein